MGPSWLTACRFQFIGFPSEWGEEVGRPILWVLAGFQFIGFPSEWGVRKSSRMTSPLLRFQFIGFPSEWGELSATQPNFTLKFPIYWVPQRVGRSVMMPGVSQHALGFQFIGFPSEWGDTPIETRMARACQGAFASISPNRYTLYCF